MKIEDLILKAGGKHSWDKGLELVKGDKVLQNLVFKEFIGQKKDTILFTSQVVSLLSESNPEVIHPYLEKMIDGLNFNSPDAYKRIVMRIFQTIDVPEKCEGKFFDLGISFLSKMDEPIAVRAFGMTALRRICEKYPELRHELIPHIEKLVTEKVSAGIINRGEKELKRLRKLI